MTPLDIIIVNFNSGSYLEKCLSSLFKYSINPRYKANVIIIDNGSTDDSLKIKDSIKYNIKVIKNKDNIGFAAACNQGAKLSNAPYLLFLNPDTQLFASSIEKPLSFIKRPENSDVAILGVQLVDQNSHVLRTCARFPTLKTFLFKALGLSKIFPNYNHFMVEWDHQETKVVDQVIGAFFLIRRKAFEKLGGFDERFFVYFEELDLSFRAAQTGWKSIYYAEVQALHEGAGSSRNIKARRLFYFLRSQILYGYKHLGRLQGTILLLSTVFLEFMARIVFAFIKGSWQAARDTWGAYLMLLKDYKNILQTLKSFRGKE
ncbi:MAG: glycosyltransferase family 2 protein [Bacillota bacterium]|jgi:N-acetylglucosaminyl-diphospho-decaprenol L-rhamnosyltransferase